ncbi:hypothetical protein QR680_011161 [Steinernema hermaphroditum]|uniref:Uncharacterized protein n=1 Tax=Steinernema hermaphroditum TaxID=289476 RepID=A0AA39IRA7_9BILA|nr:hypothetical protein QR680_011161 [Steinernema hermaphroditum]
MVSFCANTTYGEQKTIDVFTKRELNIISAAHRVLNSTETPPEEYDSEHNNVYGEFYRHYTIEASMYVTLRKLDKTPIRHDIGLRS